MYVFPKVLNFSFKTVHFYNAESVEVFYMKTLFSVFLHRTLTFIGEL